MGEVRLRGVRNFRDLGGPAVENGVVRTGRFFPPRHLHDAAPQDCSRFTGDHP